MKNFEMAHVENPAELIQATQAAVLSAMQKVMADMKVEFAGPGLTWAQIDFIIEEFKKKVPTVIQQEHEV